MLSYVNIFSKNVVTLAGFYRDVFGFEEILEHRTPIFVGLRTGQSCLGFNAQDASAFSNSLNMPIRLAPNSSSTSTSSLRLRSTA